MNVAEQSVIELESVLAQYEKENGVISLEEMVISNCQCTGVHCATSCSGK